MYKRIEKILKQINLNQADWILQGLQPHSPLPDAGYIVENCLPNCFETYVKVLPIIWEDIETEEGMKARRILWSELAQQKGYKYTPELDFWTFMQWPDSRWPDNIMQPSDGSGMHIEDEFIQILLDALASFTKDEPCQFYFDKLRTWKEPLLYEGPLVEIKQFFDPSFPLESDSSMPVYIWPVNKSWCLLAEGDLCFILIGGTKRIVHSLLENKLLEAVEVFPTTRIDGKADKTNLVT